MYCQNCGQRNADSSKFCQKCGKEIGAARSQSAPPPPAAVADASQGGKRSMLKRTVSTRWAFIIAIICFALFLFIPAFGLIGFLSLVFGIIGLIRDIRRRDPNRWQNLGLLFVAFVAFITFSYIASQRDLSSVPIPAPTSTTPTDETAAPAADTSTPPPPTETDIVLQADYDEGYKAGYADGRSAEGNLGDNYGPPATEEREISYADGYVAGFDVGCREGGFTNCDELLQALAGETGAPAD